MRVMSAGITDVGRKRDHNEDNFIVQEEMDLYVVCDGMGGHAGGEYASAIAVNTIEEALGSLSVYGASQDDDPVEIAREQLAQAVRLAGKRIHEKAATQPELRGMGTTAVSLLLRDGNAYIAHVGDSRAYLRREGRTEQITEDHSLIAEQMREGLLTAEEAKNHQLRNVITRSLGFQEDVEVDVRVMALRRGDRFLLCSDGLSGYLEPVDIDGFLAAHGPMEASRRMMLEACERGGDDNITAVVVHIEELT
jgi:serine/threonine protein phosphatase PrpC